MISADSCSPYEPSLSCALSHIHANMDWRTCAHWHKNADLHLHLLIPLQFIWLMMPCPACYLSNALTQTWKHTSWHFCSSTLLLVFQVVACPCLSPCVFHVLPLPCSHLAAAGCVCFSVRLLRECVGVTLGKKRAGCSLLWHAELMLVVASDLKCHCSFSAFKFAVGFGSGKVRSKSQLQPRVGMVLWPLVMLQMYFLGGVLFPKEMCNVFWIVQMNLNLSCT